MKENIKIPPAIENITCTQSLRDTLAFMKKKDRKVLKLVEKPNGEVFWNNVLPKPLGENGNNIKIEEYDISPIIQKKFS